MQVYMWPQTTPRLRDGVLLVGMRHKPCTTRDTARANVRKALSEALLLALDLPKCRINYDSQPGRPPQIRFPGHENAGLSISHDGDFSVAAVHFHGPVGVDVMVVQEIPDWQAVAGDYLGPDVLAHLLLKPQEQRAQEFARAWSAHEARLKYAGLALEERSAVVSPSCQTVALALPAGIVGTLALPL